VGHRWQAVGMMLALGVGPCEHVVTGVDEGVADDLL
jgi:hypothetical protein